MKGKGRRAFASSQRPKEAILTLLDIDPELYLLTKQQSEISVI